MKRRSLAVLEEVDKTIETECSSCHTIYHSNQRKVGDQCIHSLFPGERCIGIVEKRKEKGGENIGH